MTAHKHNLVGVTASAAPWLLLALAGLLSGCGRQDVGPAPGKLASTGAAPAGAAAPVAAAQSGKAGAPGHKGDKGDKGGDKPLWRSLTPAQQLALQPLAGEWDQMDGVRKQKWLQLAARFATMKPEERERVHERMREWARLTPEQRELARETYNRTRKIAPDQKTATWESYLQLPDDQKKKLAASASGRKAPSVPSSSGKSAGPLGHGAAACPAGTVKNTVSATPPCVLPGAPQNAAPEPAPVPPPAPAPQPAPPPPEKQVPENWGITPNNA